MYAYRAPQNPASRAGSSDFSKKTMRIGKKKKFSQKKNIQKIR